MLSLLSLQGCALKVLDWVTPSTGYVAQKNIAYGDLPRQQLDIFSPTEPTEKALTIVFFYGGAWQWGDKAEYRFVAQALAEQGYQVVVPDYRVYPEALFPGFMSDAAEALAWVTENIEQPVVLMGHSAGAHIAALLALDSRYHQQHQIKSAKIVGLVGLSGPYDFLPLKSERLQTIFDAAEHIDETQPINFVSAAAPPTLLIHGSDDTRVKPFNSKNLAEKLKQNQVPVSFQLYEGSSHAITVGALSRPLRRQLPILQDITQFLQGLSL